MNISTFSVCCLISICLIIPAVSSTAKDCCLSYSAVRLKDGQVKSYHIQPMGAICPINAVVLLTVKNKRICANPDIQWVQNIMTKLNKKKEESNGQAQTPRGKGKGKGRGRKRGRGNGRRKARKQQEPN